MKLKLSALLIITLLLSLISGEVLAVEKTVDAMTLYGYPPYCYLESNIQPTKSEIIKPGENSKILLGFSWEVFREAFHHQGYAIKLRVLPWARAMSSARKGKMQVIFPTGLNSSRARYFAYTARLIDSRGLSTHVRNVHWHGGDTRFLIAAPLV